MRSTAVLDISYSLSACPVWGGGYGTGRRHSETKVTHAESRPCAQEGLPEEHWLLVVLSSGQGVDQESSNSAWSQLLPCVTLSAAGGERTVQWGGGFLKWREDPEATFLSGTLSVPPPSVSALSRKRVVLVVEPTCFFGNTSDQRNCKH